MIEVVEAVGRGPVVFVGHSVSSMIGALAAAARPDLFSRLVMVGPSARYIDDGDYRGGFSSAEIHELLDTMDANYLGWAQHIAPVIMGVPERPELGEGWPAASAGAIRRSPAASRGRPSCPTTARTWLA